MDALLLIKGLTTDASTHLCEFRIMRGTKGTATLQTDEGHLSRCGDAGVGALQTILGTLHGHPQLLPPVPHPALLRSPQMRPRVHPFLVQRPLLVHAHRVRHDPCGHLYIS
jgi:hypothetical protein